MAIQTPCLNWQPKAAVAEAYLHHDFDLPVGMDSRDELSWWSKTTHRTNECCLNPLTAPPASCSSKSEC